MLHYLIKAFKGPYYLLIISPVEIVRASLSLIFVGHDSAPWRPLWTRLGQHLSYNSPFKKVFVRFRECLGEGFGRCWGYCWKMFGEVWGKCLGGCWGDVESCLDCVREGC